MRKNVRESSPSECSLLKLMIKPQGERIPMDCDLWRQQWRQPWGLQLNPGENVHNPNTHPPTSPFFTVKSTVPPTPILFTLSWVWPSDCQIVTIRLEIVRFLPPDWKQLGSDCSSLLLQPRHKSTGFLQCFQTDFTSFNCFNTKEKFKDDLTVVLGIHDRTIVVTPDTPPSERCQQNNQCFFWPHKSNALDFLLLIYRKVLKISEIVIHPDYNQVNTNWISNRILFRRF